MGVAVCDMLKTPADCFSAMTAAVMPRDGTTPDNSLGVSFDRIPGRGGRLLSGWPGSRLEKPQHLCGLFRFLLKHRPLRKCYVKRKYGIGKRNKHQ